MRYLWIILGLAVITIGSGCSNGKENAVIQTPKNFSTASTTTATPTIMQTVAPTFSSAASATTTESPAPTVSAMTPEQIIRTKAGHILNALKAGNMAKIAEFAHPDDGVRFTPYSFVNVKTDLVFKADKLKLLGTDPTVYTWGSFDGSGDPIKYTYSNYNKKFVYDQDYLTASHVSYNKIIGKGNTVNNILNIYTGASFMEYHFPGFETKYEGMDWKSLRLFFSQKGSEWYLIGIQHDQWTI